MSKFSSLVRARDLVFPQSQPLVKNCQSGISPVDYYVAFEEIFFFVFQLCHDETSGVCCGLGLPDR